MTLWVGHRALRDASDTSKNIVKPTAAKRHARFERGYDGSGSAELTLPSSANGSDWGKTVQSGRTSHCSTRGADRVRAPVHGAREGFQIAGIDGSRQLSGVPTRDRGRKILVLTYESAIKSCFPGSIFFHAAIDKPSFYCNLCADWQLAVDEVHRVLKPGGLFLTASFTVNCWAHGAGREVEWRDRFIVADSHISSPKANSGILCADSARLMSSASRGQSATKTRTFLCGLRPRPSKRPGKLGCSGNSDLCAEQL